MSSANIWAVANLHVHASKQHRANDRAFQAESKKNERQIYYKKKKKIFHLNGLEPSFFTRQPTMSTTSDVLNR